MKVVITGGHPGDPECGCGGTIARYIDAGHHVALLYLNRGEGYCGQNDTKDCAQIRTAEAEKACAILKAHALFAAQTDGRAVVDPPHYEEFSRLLLAQEPHIVFTHWPTDAHRDHRAISALVLDAWLASKKKFALYYYEVAEDTMRFSATDFVDTSGVADLHRAACYAHASQQPNKWFPLQFEMIRYHGLQPAARKRRPSSGSRSSHKSSYPNIRWTPKQNLGTNSYRSAARNGGHPEKSAKRDNQLWAKEEH